MSEAERIRDERPFSMPAYSKEMKSDCLALYIKGYGSRQIRRLLATKYKDTEKVPDSRLMRTWISKYSQEVKGAVAKSREMDVLIALEAEGEYLEDVSDDILSYAIPATMKDLEEGKFKELPTQDKIQIVLKELNAKAQRVERKILRLDPQAANTTPLQIFIQNAQAKKREQDGTTADASPDIIDVEVVEG